MRSCGLLARAGCLERGQRAALPAETEWGSLMPDGTEARWPCRTPGVHQLRDGARQPSTFSFKPKGSGVLGDSSGVLLENFCAT